VTSLRVPSLKLLVVALRLQRLPQGPGRSVTPRSPITWIWGVTAKTAWRMNMGAT
jgi:hypothetical protein